MARPVEINLIGYHAKLSEYLWVKSAHGHAKFGLPLISAADQEECAMNRNDELRDDLIDLGAVTQETKGKLVGIDDHDNGLQNPLGLSDD